MSVYALELLNVTVTGSWPQTLVFEKESVGIGTAKTDTPVEAIAEHPVEDSYAVTV